MGGGWPSKEYLYLLQATSFQQAFIRTTSVSVLLAIPIYHGHLGFASKFSPAFVLEKY